MSKQGIRLGSNAMNSMFSPLRLIVLMIAVIFAAEMAVMSLLFWLGHITSLEDALTDASMLSVLIVIPTYLLIFKPMQAQQAQLDRNQRWLKTITDNLPEALVSIDPDGNVESFNPAAENMFGYATNDIIGRGVQTLMAEKRASGKSCGVKSLLEDQGTPLGDGVETVGLRADGTRFPVELHIKEVILDGRSFCIALLRDISERKREEQRQQQIQERIERTQRMESLGVLAGGIAHDFNNILAAIMGNAELVGFAIKDDDAESRRSLDNIESGCNHAADLCRQMLAYAGKGSYRLEMLNLSGLLPQMERLIHISVPRSIELEQHLDPKLPNIHADQAQVEQVILNLLTNAAEAIGSSRGRITLTTGVMEASAKAFEKTLLPAESPQPGSYVYLEVRDNGCGIDTKDMPRLFEPFFTTKFTGRGLGMSAVLGILTAHNGGISINSTLGQGTTIRVLFPAATEAAAPAEPALPETRPEAELAGTILVVDDEPKIREILDTMLRRMGFDTLMAEDGEQAITMLEQHGSELAAMVLDLTMPKVGGEEVFRQSRKQHPDLPVLIASGHGENAQDLFGEQMPDAFIAKPFRFRKLQAELQRLLA